MRSPHVLPASNVAFWQSSQLLSIPAWYFPTEIPWIGTQTHTDESKHPDIVLWNRCYIWRERNSLEPKLSVLDFVP